MTEQADLPQIERKYGVRPEIEDLIDQAMSNPGEWFRIEMPNRNMLTLLNNRVARRVATVKMRAEYLYLKWEGKNETPSQSQGD